MDSGNRNLDLIGLQENGEATVPSNSDSRAEVAEEGSIRRRRGRRQRQRSFLVGVLIVVGLALAVTTGMLIRILIRNHSIDSTAVELQSIAYSRTAAQSFCSVSNHTLWCVNAFSKIRCHALSKPDDVFTSAIRISVSNLQNLISAFTRISLPDSRFRGNTCSTSLVDSLRLLNDTLRMIDTPPDPTPGNIVIASHKVKWWSKSSNSRRDEMRSKITEAEENLEHCSSTLEKTPKSREVDDLKEKAQEVKMYLRSSIEFLRQYDKVIKEHRNSYTLTLTSYSSRRPATDLGDVIFVASPFVFMFFLFLALFRVR